MNTSLNAPFLIHHATPDPGVAEGLADVLLDVVEGGASVGFMYPLPCERRSPFGRTLWTALSEASASCSARDAELGTIIGTMQVVLSMPENQPHRADIAKMQVRRSARRCGVGTALIRAAENAACNVGKT